MAAMAPSFLLSLSLAPTTLKAYKQALKKLVAYLDEHPEYTPTNVERLDNLVSAFTHHLFSQNPSRGNRQIASPIVENEWLCIRQLTFPCRRIAHMGNRRIPRQRFEPHGIEYFFDQTHPAIIRKTPPFAILPRIARANACTFLPAMLQRMQSIVTKR